MAALAYANFVSAEEYTKESASFGKAEIRLSHEEVDLTLLRRRASNNDIAAKNTLGSLYFMGKAPALDAGYAMSLIMDAGVAGHAIAQANLGLIYGQGHHVGRDMAKSRYWFEKAASQDDLLSIHNLGLIRLHGLNEVQDAAQAFMYFRLAAERGYEPSQMTLSLMYISGTGIPTTNYFEAVIWLQRAAGQHNILAKRTLGDIYYRGVLGTPNVPLAAHWYAQAAIDGDATAQIYLGYILQSGGEEFEPDVEKGRVWLQRAAEQGYIEAQRFLGLSYLNNEPNNIQRGMYWLFKSVHSGDVESGLYMARHFLHAASSEVDFELRKKLLVKAEDWYLWGARQGNIGAQAGLGEYYETGRFGRKSEIKAFRWNLKAATQELPSAQMVVGEAYFHGKGTKKDVAKAFNWYKAAMVQGHENATTGLVALYKDKECDDEIKRDIYNILMGDLKSDCYEEILEQIKAISDKHALAIGFSERQQLAQQWVEALLAGRASAMDVGSQPQRDKAPLDSYSAADPIPAPKTWEDAKAEVPGLTKWSAAKEANPNLTIIDHMRDATHGYGHWALTERGLPRSRLKTWGDNAAYQALRRVEIPPDLRLPKREPDVSSEPIDPDALRAAYRLIKRAERAQER